MAPADKVPNAGGAADVVEVKDPKAGRVEVVALAVLG